MGDDWINCSDAMLIVTASAHELSLCLNISKIMVNPFVTIQARRGAAAHDMFRSFLAASQPPT
jgi:hypothetical protein